MVDVVELLIDNLKETFRIIERFLLLGLTAALVLLVLAITNRDLSGVQKVMFTDLNAPSVLVAFVALGTYFSCGSFAVFYFAARRRIVRRLRMRDPEIVEASMTFPSIVAKIGAPQIVALACVGGTGIVALVLFYLPTHELRKALAAGVLMGSPYIALCVMAFWTAIDER